MASSQSRVFLAESGSTPRKEQKFNVSSPPMNIIRASPERKGYRENGVLKTTPQRNDAQTRRKSLQDYDESEEIDSRPTTSRKIPNPSPEKFTSYIVPSPTKVKGDAVWTVEEEKQDAENTDYDSDEYYEYESNLSANAQEFRPNQRNRANSDLSATAEEWYPRQTELNAEEDLATGPYEWDPLAQPTTVPHEIGRFMLFVALAS